MSTDSIVPTVEPTPEERLAQAAYVLSSGDISKMTKQEKDKFLIDLAKAMGLNPFPAPFAIITDQKGRQFVYALKSCSDQLRRKYDISIEILYAGPLMIGEVPDNDVYLVKARAKMGDRVDEEFGTIWLKSTTGDERANAILKAVTKAKRRVTFSICGLAFLDETEVETIKPSATVSGPRQIVPSIPTHTLTSGAEPANLVKTVEAELVKTGQQIK